MTKNLKTVFCLLDMRAFSWLVAGVTPFNFRPVIGHLGTEGRFFKYWKRPHQWLRKTKSETLPEKPACHRGSWPPSFCCSLCCRTISCDRWYAEPFRDWLKSEMRELISTLTSEHKKYSNINCGQNKSTHYILLEQFHHKLEYCTVGSLWLRLWRRLFTGVTPPDRGASGLVRKGVGHWIIFRAVATPVPTVYPIPSQQLKVKRQMLGQISHLACSNLLLIGPFYNLETFWQLHSLVWSSPSNKFFSRSN